MYNIYIVILYYGNGSNAGDENSEKERMEVRLNRRFPPYFVKKGCLRPIPVPYHKGKDNNLGDFAKEILKEANIDPKTLKEVEK